MNAYSKRNWYRSARMKTDQKIVHGAECKTNLHQGNTRRMKVERGVRQEGCLLFIVHYIQLVQRIPYQGDFSTFWRLQINPLKTKGRLFYLKTQFVLRSKHFSSRL